jgi:hypothetical protein
MIIKSEYLKLVKEFHPDVNKDMENEVANEYMIIVNYVYENLIHKRLLEHKKSIEAVENLNDFFCRFLLVDDIWIPLGESLLIEKTKPLWNIVVDGFGNHYSGSGQYNQQISAWDTIYPGRSWTKKLQKGKTEKEIIDQINNFLYQ